MRVNDDGRISDKTADDSSLSLTLNRLDALPRAIVAYIDFNGERDEPTRLSITKYGRVHATSTILQSLHYRRYSRLQLLYIYIYNLWTP